jgi:lambda repressor-like predicted transcriptional regulator
MTENKTKPELSPLETVERNLKAALNAWTEEINVSELPKAMQRKHRVANDKLVALVYDVHQHLTTKRQVGRPAGGLTKTTVRNELKNATPEQIAAIAKILGQKPETEIPPVSADMENSVGVNVNE